MVWIFLLSSWYSGHMMIINLIGLVHILSLIPSIWVLHCCTLSSYESHQLSLTKVCEWQTPGSKDQNQVYLGPTKIIPSHFKIYTKMIGYFLLVIKRCRGGDDQNLLGEKCASHHWELRLASNVNFNILNTKFILNLSNYFILSGIWWVLRGIWSIGDLKEA